MEDGGNKGIVNVCGGGRAALNDPQFLIEHEGKLYLTLAVLEYDPKYPGLSEHQREDIEKLRSILKGSNLTGTVTPYETRGMMFSATNPPQPQEN
jgi:hypothetical protein